MCVERTRSLSPPPGGLSVLTLLKTFACVFAACILVLWGLRGKVTRERVILHPPLQWKWQAAHQEDQGSAECQMAIGFPQGRPQQRCQMVPCLGRISGKDLYKREQSFGPHQAVCAIKCLTNGCPEKKSLVCSAGQLSWCKHSPHPQLQVPDVN